MDDDYDDGIADYAALLTKSKKKAGAPKRGNKSFAPNDTVQQETAIQQSRDALFELIGEKKALSAQHSIGVLDHVTLTTTVVQKKGTHFQFMGHTVEGSMTLFLEEAAWLVNRQALCTYKQKNNDSGNASDNDDDVTFEDYCALIFASQDGWITYEKYQVYAYLKRLGYIVQRSSLALRQQQQQQQQQEQQQSKKSWLCRYCRSLYSRLITLLRPIIRLIGHSPLVRHYQYSTFGHVYSKLHIIPFSPWYHDESEDKESVSYPYTPTWDVYKPNPKWKKRDPGVPDFRVVVGNMNEPLPTTDNLHYLFKLMYGLPYNDSTYHAIRHTRSSQSQPAFLMGLVGYAEGVTFLRLQADGISNIVRL